MAFETQDESVWHAYLRELRAGPARADWAMTRVDILCGRLVQPTTYRLSVFVPDTACDQSQLTTRHRRSRSGPPA